MFSFTMLSYLLLGLNINRLIEKWVSGPSCTDDHIHQRSLHGMLKLRLFMIYTKLLLLYREGIFFTDTLLSLL